MEVHCGESVLLLSLTCVALEPLRVLLKVGIHHVLESGTQRQCGSRLLECLSSMDVVHETATPPHEDEELNDEHNKESALPHGIILVNNGHSMKLGSGSVVLVNVGLVVESI